MLLGWRFPSEPVAEMPLGVISDLADPTAQCATILAPHQILHVDVPIKPETVGRSEPKPALEWR